MMEYKGYEAVVSFDEDANAFYGEVINTRDVITFQGTTVAALKKALRESVEDYLAFCKERGEEPNKSFSWNFILRIRPDLHRQLYSQAKKSGKSLNAFIEERLSQ
jgi:predicted HicB family RNase H-like nuclease